MVLDADFNWPYPGPRDEGRASKIEDAGGRYIVYTKSCFPSQLTLSGLRIVVDCANGASYKVAPLALEELGAEVFRIGTTPDGTNINEHCGSLHPEVVAAKVREVRADVGLALDGDADRLIVVDEHGNIIDGDQLMAMLEALHSGQASSRLLFGVTGSGKTAVYLELAKACLAAGKSMLLLAPEVALAHKLRRDAACALPDAPLFFHHGYQSPARREATFRQLAERTAPCIVVGTRSALFLPVPNLACIVLDEEHVFTGLFVLGAGFFARGQRNHTDQTLREQKRVCNVAAANGQRNVLNAPATAPLPHT